jgi:hypothetical protein
MRPFVANRTLKTSPDGALQIRFLNVRLGLP